MMIKPTINHAIAGKSISSRVLVAPVTVMPNA